MSVSFNGLFSNEVQSHTFWNETIFSYVTEKYMEFDLNDKGEIGKIEPTLKLEITFSYN